MASWFIQVNIFSAKILLFYVIFYAVLSGFFGAMLAVFYQTLDPNAPKWQLDNSLIGSNPGLGFRPMPPESNVESTLIWYKASDEGNYLHWNTWTKHNFQYTITYETNQICTQQLSTLSNKQTK